MSTLYVDDPLLFPRLSFCIVLRRKISVLKTRIVSSQLRIFSEYDDNRTETVDSTFDRHCNISKMNIHSVFVHLLDFK